MVRSRVLRQNTLPAPPEGMWRLHRAPMLVRAPESDTPRDRFDDPDLAFGVRYFASSWRGAMLEVLDHFRVDDETESALASVVVAPHAIDILEEEPPGSVPERWLSGQLLVRGQVPAEGKFVDVNDADVLAKLNDHPRVRAALGSEEVARALGASVRLDGGTIRLGGPVGRRITQAVSRAVYDDPEQFIGIAYATRFDDTQQCWAIFDDRVSVEFDKLQRLDNTNAEQIRCLNEVAELYRLDLPINWRDDLRMNAGDTDKQ